MVNRLAFTMIELIFAIVIISIAVLSLPMMNQVIAKNTEGSVLQEAIFAASAELNQVLSYKWDENSIEGTSDFSRVVWASSTECNNDTKLRLGHINQPYHRRCTDDNSTRVDNSTLDDNVTSINDAAYSISKNLLDGSGSASGYKNDYNSIVTIQSPANFDGNSTDNMKRVRIQVLNSGSTIIQLDSFTANIGEIDYYKRSY